jgi:plasmid stability protein
MPQILVRDLDEKTVNRLKKRAALNGRSLQQEVKLILKDVPEPVDYVKAARRIQEMLRKKYGKQSDSGELQAEERMR